MVKVIIHLETEKEHSRVEKEIDFGNELEGMTDEEINDYIETATREIKDEMYEWGWKIIPEEPKGK